MPILILLVEDNAATRLGLSALLTESGYEVAAAGTLREALTMLAEREPALLLTDIRLDGYNGLHLLAAGPRQVPTIVMTGFPDPALEAEARRLGAEFLLKPVPPAVLLDLVRRMIDRAEAAGADVKPVRRWARRALATRLPVRIEQAPARIVDVSYGGACLELPRAPGAWLPFSSQLTVPDVALSVHVDVIWKKRSGEASWLCGAAVRDEHQPMWRGLVDAIT
jgi:FixJ family two-component response regulator